MPTIIRDFHGHLTSHEYTLIREGIVRIIVACEACGEEDWKPNLHHIDINGTNNRLANLILLCRPCHMRFHHGRNGDVEGETTKRFTEIASNPVRLAKITNDLCYYMDWPLWEQTTTMRLAEEAENLRTYGTRWPTEAQRRDWEQRVLNEL